MGNRKQKTLITGGLGFIGSHIKKALPDADILDLKDGIDIRYCDLKEKYDVIYHCAAQASIPLSFEKPILSHEHNVVGTLKILEYARQTGAKVVFSSSSSIYGEAPNPTNEYEKPDPVSPYALQKLLCEEYMRFYWKLGVKSIALRYFNVFGENQEIANGGYALVLSKFLNQYKNREPFTIVGDGEQRRDFVYVDDVVEANLKATDYLEAAEGFRIINIGSGNNYSINEVCNMINKNHPRIFLPPRIEPRSNQADIRRAEILLKWKPKTTLKKWLKKTVSIGKEK